MAPEVFGKTPKGRRNAVCPDCREIERQEREAREAAREAARATWLDEESGRMVRRCCGCKVVKDLESEFYRSNPKLDLPNAGAGYGYLCKRCTVERTTERQRQARADPETGKAFREKQLQYRANWRARNPDAVAAAARRQRERVRRDPLRQARVRESNRMGYHLRAMRAGIKTTTRPDLTASVPEWHARMPRLPAPPLAVVLHREYERMVAEGDESPQIELARRFGMSDRRLRALGVTAKGLRKCQQDTVRLDTADAVLVGLGLVWEDVWPEAEYPEVAAVLGA